MVGYAECLFLAFAIPAWHAAARGRWWRAAALAGLAGLVRVDAVFLVLALVWFEWLLDGRTDDAMAFFEFADGLITRVTDFWPEPYEPPPGREHLVERWLPGGRGDEGRN